MAANDSFDNHFETHALAVAPGQTAVHGRPEWTHYLPPPPLVVRTTNDSCWAAATESFLDVVSTSGGPTPQSELMKGYSDKPNGGISEWGYDKVRHFYGMDSEHVFAKSLDAKYLAKKLRTFGYVILIFNLGSTGTHSHAHLVYGVGYPNGKDLLISVMNPENVSPPKVEPRCTYVNYSIGFYNTKVKDVMVVWPLPGSR